jgi:precorrin-6A/cobalt-precorrin-6A reductase
MKTAKCNTILLIGGTSDAAPIAEALAGHGYAVLVATATDEPLNIGGLPGIHRRIGRLDAAAMEELLRTEGCVAVVCAAHPYAAAVRATARTAALAAGVPCWVYERPGLATAAPVPETDSMVHWAAGHEAAARLAFALGQRVLLTTGANHLQPYAQEARRTGGALVARVLPRPESLAACAAAGIAADRIIAAKGPFTEDENRAHLRQFGLQVLVTKDSGEAGGVQAKLAAARLENCQVIIVRRPAAPDAPAVYASIDALVQAVVTVHL